MMDLLQTHIRKTITSAIRERLIPEIKNMVETLPFAQHVVEPCTSLNEDGIGNAWESANIKFTKKVSGSACDLMDHTGTSSYNIIFGQVGNPRKVNFTDSVTLVMPILCTININRISHKKQYRIPVEHRTNKCE